MNIHYSARETPWFGMYNDGEITIYLKAIRGNILILYAILLHEFLHHIISKICNVLSLSLEVETVLQGSVENLTFWLRFWERKNR